VEGRWSDSQARRLLAEEVVVGVTEAESVRRASGGVSGLVGVRLHRPMRQTGRAQVAVEEMGGERNEGGRRRTSCAFQHGPRY